MYLPLKIIFTIKTEKVSSQNVSLLIATIPQSYLELELHSLEDGGGLDVPGPLLLGHLHHGGGNSGSFSKQHADVESLNGTCEYIC